jgi:3-phosphoshikimate 1-carboxyvinyltransferase
MSDWIAAPNRALHGTLDLPGDKSVSHRAIMLAAIADGVSRIDGFLEGEDTCATAAVFRQLGVRIDTPRRGVRIVHGIGVDGLRAPDAPLDCGNAGTAMRLLAGLLAGQPFASKLVGDASLSKRPMQRVIEPLAMMGARIDADDGHAPLHVHGGQRLHAIDYSLPVASAQVKSALLLAGLFADGETCIREPHPTRDYTERMLEAFAYPISYRSGEACVRGGHRLQATDIGIPADFSSAAFFIVAATIVPGSQLRLRRVGINPRRTGLLHVLRAMGANIVEDNVDTQGGETVADLLVTHAPLHGVDVPIEHVADMIDEFPALFIAAACARGVTTIRGAAELRVKESDRIATVAAGLAALGIDVTESVDGATIRGGVMDAGRIDSRGDHRVAMAFAVAAQVAAGEVAIADVVNVATSFPGFDALARQAGFGLRAP